MHNEYYDQIKERLIDVEVNNKVKDYSKNKVTLENYYEIGKILYKAQGGEERAKYGDNLIKEYSRKLKVDVDKKYSDRTLRRIRQFYILFRNQKWSALPTKLSWSHITELLVLNDFNEINYYIDVAIKENLNYRKLGERIRNKEYKKLSDITKQKLINKEKLELTESVKETIIIHNPNNIEMIKEKTLQKLIMENIYAFLKQLGSSYMFVGNEYPIKLDNRYYKIDLLLYNMEYESYVVVELKVGELKHKDIGQIKFYINYIDKNLKKITQNKTVGIILCHKNNKLIMGYCTDPRIIIRKYVLI